MNSERPYPPMMPQAPQPVFQTPPVTYAATSLTPSEKRKGQKIKVAFYATMMFALLSYTGVYRAVNVMYNAITSRPFEVVDDNGSPTIKGLMVHSIAFFFGILFLMSKLE